MKRSLALRLSIYIAVIVILISAGLGLFSYYKGSEAVLTKVEEALEIQAAQASNYIEQRVENQLAALEAIAARPEIRGMDWHAQEQVLASELERLQSFKLLAIFDSSAQGRMHSGELVNGSEREYVKEALQGNRAISDLLINQVTGEIQIIVAVPIRENGRVVGALVGAFDADAFSGLVEELGFGETGEAFILQEDGTVIAHADRSLVLNQRSVFTDPELLGVGAALQKLGEAKSGLISYDLSGQAKLGGVQYVPAVGWTVVVMSTEAEMLEEVDELRNYLVLLSLAFAAGGALVGLIMARQIVRPLEMVKSVIETVAEGDLTGQAQVSSRDEVGAVADALNRTTKSMKQALERTAEASREVHEISQELAAMAQEVSASIEEVASTTNQFAGTTETMNHNAQAVSAKVEAIQESAEGGSRAIGNITGQMEMLRNKAEAMSREIGELGMLSEQVGNIAHTIGAIADQTNLLALNAAIEAARAGEHGRGFAVVADEVRKLAEESSRATAEIDDLIQKVQERIALIVREMDVSNQMTRGAMDTVDESSSLLGTILEEVQEIAEQVEALSQALDEVSAGSQGIASATQEQAATIQEVAGAAQSLSRMAEALQELMAHFKMT